MKPEVVVFDLGGVLCEFSTKRRLDALSSASGLPPHEVALRLDDCRLIELADRGQLTREAEYERAIAALELECDYPTYRALWCSEFMPDPGVIAIARTVRHQARTAILTNNGPVLLDALTLTSVTSASSLLTCSSRPCSTPRSPRKLCFAAWRVSWVWLPKISC